MKKQALLKNKNYDFKNAHIDAPRSVCWLKNDEIPTLISKLSLILKIDPDMFENICLTKYNRFNI